MFVCVATYRAKADEEDAIIALHENWELQRCIKADDTFSCELLPVSLLGKMMGMCNKKGEEGLPVCRKCNPVCRVYYGKCE